MTNRLLIFSLFFLTKCTQLDSSELLYLRILESNNESPSPNAVITKIKIEDNSIIWKDRSPKFSGVDFDLIIGNDTIPVFIDRFDPSKKTITLQGMTSQFIFYKQHQLDSISNTLKANIKLQVNNFKGTKKLVLFKMR